MNYVLLKFTLFFAIAVITTNAIANEERDQFDQLEQGMTKAGIAFDEYQACLEKALTAKSGDVCRVRQSDAHLALSELRNKVDQVRNAVDSSIDVCVLIND
ncbi:hypothetical protein [Thalassotalea sp. ND16A]|uniref:hypothetical protein n=1 Tax=Thalassotalea sp. ND16A TaxID=1535422 RepID=UPI00051A35E7|nr:hypothetical protein [Thalassotalea sp. ND16A]KGJ99311.1 hypothetical protein ND16A_3832 [Thalassotalea sp. ND16A]